MPVLRASGAIESVGFGPRDCDRNVCKLQSCSPTITRPPRHVLNGHSPGTLRHLRPPVSFAIISSRSTNSVTVSRQWLSFFCCFFFLCSLGTGWHFIIHPAIWKLTLLCRFSLHPTAAVRGLTEFLLLPLPLKTWKERHKGIELSPSLVRGSLHLPEVISFQVLTKQYLGYHLLQRKVALLSHLGGCGGLSWQPDLCSRPHHWKSSP